VCTSGSRTIPPLPTLPTGFELGLHEHDDVGGIGRAGKERRHGAQDEMKERSATATFHRTADELGRDHPDVGAFEHAHTGILPEPPVELAAPTSTA